MIKSIYQQDGATLYHGDSREVLPLLSTDRENTVIITDPVWPDAPEGLFPGVDPFELFANVAQHFPRLAVSGCGAG